MCDCVGWLNTCMGGLLTRMCDFACGIGIVCAAYLNSAQSAIQQQQHIRWSLLRSVRTKEMQHVICRGAHCDDDDDDGAPRHNNNKSCLFYIVYDDWGLVQVRHIRSAVSAAAEPSERARWKTSNNQFNARHLGLFGWSRRCRVTQFAWRCGDLPKSECALPSAKCQQFDRSNYTQLTEQKTHWRRST